MEKYLLAFLKCKGIGNVKLLNYIKKYNFNIEQILKNKSEIININELSTFDDYVKKAEIEINNNKIKGVEIISIFNSKYPNKLVSIKDPILYLYYKGNINLIYNTTIAIIGSRDITDSEKKLTANISRYISSKNITIVSGLALGTDTFAHIGAIKEVGNTIAILPSGIDVITPQSNKNLAEEIVKNEGLLISEYSNGTVAAKYTYVKRDRIQAALSDAIVVVKASEVSGTMYAVKLAQDLKKYVAQYKENNNSLIRNTFGNKEDINFIINKAKNMIYKFEKEIVYEQESLF